MLFGIIILILVAGIAFYHYLQGFFSSMISATLAVLAALVAVSYHEQVGWSLFGSTIPGYATATALVGLCAYIRVCALADRPSCSRQCAAARHCRQDRWRWRSV